MTLPHGLAFHGSGLERPECVLAHRSGLLFTADWRGAGGVAIIRPDGAVTRIEARGIDEPLRPNGIALAPDGRFIIAHLGDACGGVFRIDCEGRVESLVTHVEGQPIPPTNFVMLDDAGRLWITVSTRHVPRHAAARADIADGFVAVLEPGGTPRMVIDGLGYTNECLLSPDGCHLYVNETFGRRTSRFELRQDGTAGPREIVTEHGPGTFPDGLAADVDGALWVTSIVSNRVIRIGTDGTTEVLVEDAATDALAETEALYQRDALDTPTLNRRLGRTLANISSLAFGGPDLRTAYLGCLHGDAIASFAAPVTGRPPVHWTADLTPLVAAGLIDEATSSGDDPAQATQGHQN